MGDPVPRAQAAIREKQAAVEQVKKAMEDYRAGRVSCSVVNKANNRNAKADRHLYDVESGRIDDYRN
jgi:hypothetical protein